MDFSSHPWGVLRTNNEDHVKTPGIFAGNTGLLPDFQPGDIARPESRWSGTSRPGFSRPELDRLLDAFDTALDHATRIQLIT